MSSSYTVRFEQDPQDVWANRSLLLFQDQIDTQTRCNYTLAGHWFFIHDVLFNPTQIPDQLIMPGDLCVMSALEKGSKIALTVQPNYKTGKSKTPAWITAGLKLPEAAVWQIAHMNMAGLAMMFNLQVSSFEEGQVSDIQLLGLMNDLAAGTSPDAACDFKVEGWNAVVMKET